MSKYLYMSSFFTPFVYFVNFIMTVDNTNDITPVEFSAFLEHFSKSSVRIPTMDEICTTGTVFTRNSLHAAFRMGSVKFVRRIMEVNNFPLSDYGYSEASYQSLKGLNTDRCMEMLNFLRESNPSDREVRLMLIELVKNNGKKGDRHQAQVFPWILQHFTMEQLESCMSWWSLDFCHFLHREGKMTEKHAAKLLSNITLPFSHKGWLHDTFYEDAVCHIPLTTTTKMKEICKNWDAVSFYNLMDTGFPPLKSVQFLLHCHPGIGKNNIQLSEIKCQSVDIWSFLHSHFQLEAADIVKDENKVLKGYLARRDFTVCDWMYETYDLRNVLTSDQKDELVSSIEKQNKDSSQYNWVQMRFIYPEEVYPLWKQMGTTLYVTSRPQHINFRDSFFVVAAQEGNVNMLKWIRGFGPNHVPSVEKAVRDALERASIPVLDFIQNEFNLTRSVYVRLQDVSSKDVLDWLHTHFTLKLDDLCQHVSSTVLLWFAEHDLLDKSVLLDRYRHVMKDLGADILVRAGITKDDLLPFLIECNLDTFKKLHDKYQFEVEDVRFKVSKVAESDDVEFLTWFLTESGLTFHVQDVFTPANLSLRVRCLFDEHIEDDSYHILEICVNRCWADTPDQILRNAMTRVSPEVAEWCIRYYSMDYNCNPDFWKEMRSLTKGNEHKFERIPCLVAPSLNEIAELLKTGDVKLKGGVSLQEVFQFQLKINRLVADNTALTRQAEVLLWKELQELII